MSVGIERTNGRCWDITLSRRRDSNLFLFSLSLLLWQLVRFYVLHSKNHHSRIIEYRAKPESGPDCRRAPFLRRKSYHGKCCFSILLRPLLDRCYCTIDVAIFTCSLKSPGDSRDDLYCFTSDMVSRSQPWSVVTGVRHVYPYVFECLDLKPSHKELRVRIGGASFGCGYPVPPQCSTGFPWVK